MHDGEHDTPDIHAAARRSPNVHGPANDAHGLLETQTRQHCAGILLAAGFGRRFMAAQAQAQATLSPPAEEFAAAMHAGQPGKLSARLPDGRTLAQTAAQALCAATACTVAVVRPDTPALHVSLRDAGATVLISEDARRGMGASLAAAARHLIAHCGPDVRTALIALADMPWISAATYTRVTQAAQIHAIVVPTFKGRRGHPVALQRHLWPALAELDGDVGARTIVQRHPVHEIEIPDPGILRDVDVPADLLATVDNKPADG